MTPGGAEDGGAPPAPIPLLARRLIEAQLLEVVREVLDAELGEEIARSLLAKVVEKDAVDHGRILGLTLPGSELERIRRLWESIASSGALELEISGRDDRELRIRVTRCRFAEMYRAHRLEKVGRISSCGRDGPFLEGFAPGVELETRGNILDGQDSCEFTYRKKGD
jgi:hypothetical protein